MRLLRFISLPVVLAILNIGSAVAQGLTQNFALACRLTMSLKSGSIVMTLWCDPNLRKNLPNQEPSKSADFCGRKMSG